MSKDYQPLGKHLRLVDTRNAEMVTDRLLGINIDKFFMPSVANVIGTDLSRYKLISKGLFACNPMHVGRDERLPVALYTEDTPAIVSPAYMMFEIIDENILLPEYLMMWFRRAEFDRICWLKTDGSVRGGLSWGDLGRMELPVPPLDRQKAMVKAYQAITDRIALKRQINDNLEATAQAIFRSWFIDFLFVDTTEFYQSDFGDTPVGWKFVSLGDLCLTVTKGTTPTTLGLEFSESGIMFIKGECLTDDHRILKDMAMFIDSETDSVLSRSRIRANDILFSIAGTLGKFAFVRSDTAPANTNQAIAIIRANEKHITPITLYSYFIGGWHESFYKQNVQQAVQANLSLTTIKDLPMLIPPAKLLLRYSSLIEPIHLEIWRNHQEIDCLNKLATQLLQELSSGQ